MTWNQFENKFFSVLIGTVVIACGWVTGVLLIGVAIESGLWLYTNWKQSLTYVGFGLVFVFCLLFLQWLTTAIPHAYKLWKDLRK